MDYVKDSSVLDSVLESVMDSVLGSVLDSVMAFLLDSVMHPVLDSVKDSGLDSGNPTFETRLENVPCRRLHVCASIANDPLKVHACLTGSISSMYPAK